MENKRLLTKQEIEMAERRGNSTVPPYGSGAAEHRSAENQAICEAQDAKTLREVVGWITEQDKCGLLPLKYITPEEAEAKPYKVSIMAIPWEVWQAKLKEWEIE